jgi:hypothetical protein
MSEKMTAVHVPGGPGFQVRGHVSYEDATGAAEAHYESQLRQATAALEAIRAGTARVTHRRGVYRATDIRAVEPARGRTGR